MIRGEAHAMADYASASAMPGGRGPASRISVGMVAYFGMAISLNHR
jgi:hypothetical protein